MTQGAVACLSVITVRFLIGGYVGYLWVEHHSLEISILRRCSLLEQRQGHAVKIVKKFFLSFSSSWEAARGKFGLSFLLQSSFYL